MRRGERDSVVILGAGPNRIGQGIEFDYCCVHAAMTTRELGRDAVMINCNPETVSTDYDTSDRLYFEPLTIEDVLAVCEQERPEGVIVQFGGQTPLKLARALEEAGVPLLGTPVDAIDLAEDRGRFGALLRRLGIKHPPYGTALSAEEAAVIAEEVGFPLLVRPSYVLGGRAMEICYSTENLNAYLEANVKADQEHPLLLDRFLENAIEVDVDALADGTDVHVAGIMQHVEEAGVHSGDSACVMPPMSIGEEMLEEIRATTERIALELGVVGLINIQYGIAGGELYVIEANPRASRTVPFVSKATGTPLAKVAARLMLGERLADLDLPEPPTGHVSVKEAVLPFARFAGVDSVLGPEMKSTGEVMGIAADFPTAFAKAQAAAGVLLPTEGSVFITVTDTDKPAATQLAARFHDLGFEVIATGGTAQSISSMGVPVTRINKLGEGSPNVVDLIRERRCDLVINTPTGSGARADGQAIRTAAVRHWIPCVTTMTGASAAVRAIAAQKQGEARSCPCRRSTRLRGPRSLDERSVGAPALRGDGEPRLGRLPRLLPARPRRPRAAPGQFYMLAAERHWEERAQRPFLPRALSVADTEPVGGGVRLDFLIEGIGPGTDRLCELRGGGAGLGQRPARQLLLGAARADPGRGRGDPGRRRDRHRSAGPAAPQLRRSQRADPHPARLSRRGPLRRPRRPLPLLRGRPGQRRRPRRPSRLRHRPARGDARRRRRVQRRRLRLRPAADAGRRAALCAAGGVACELAMESPMACGFGACFGCAVPKADGGYLRLCVDGPVVRGG